MQKSIEKKDRGGAAEVNKRERDKKTLALSLSSERDIYKEERAECLVHFQN